jgi:hypothetical protein
MEDKVTNPDEKSLAGVLSHDEKVAGAPPPELAEQTGRSKAVALNIVQNPLTVGFANIHPLYRSYSVVTHILCSHSATPRNKSSSMPELSPSRMTCLSTLNCLKELLLSRVSLRHLN